MDSVNLKTASSYLNNLLLARGLLRNGKAIEFARPHKAAGGTEVTMAQIINLVHDMVLKRDREQEQRESLAETIRSMRFESNQTILAHERLQTRYDDLIRTSSLSQSSEKAARIACRAAEATTRKLKAEMTRLEASVQQIRDSCDKDRRKRDLELQKLKTHLSSQQRGNRNAHNNGTTTIVISPGPLGTTGINLRRDEEDAPTVDDPGYTLRQETTEFLTRLSQSLGDENDGLIGLIQNTLVTLKELQGLPENAERAGTAPPLDAIDEKSCYHTSNMVQALPVSYDTLATDMDLVLDNLRNLLTNPNFVPIEEVTVREEEIAKLRSGWDKMELKWKEAIGMMDGWRRRMLSGGEMVNVEEIKRGLGLGRDLNLAQHVEEIEHKSSSEDHSDYSSETNSSDLDLLTSKTGPTLPARIFDENPAHANEGASPKKKVEFRSDDDHQYSHGNENSNFSSNIKPSSAITLPLEVGLPPALTVQEKLNVAQAEAEAAAVAAGLNLEEIKPPPASINVTKRLQKTKISGKPRRRKSTLTPNELERLMFDN